MKVLRSAFCLRTSLPYCRFSIRTPSPLQPINSFILCNSRSLTVPNFGRQLATLGYGSFKWDVHTPCKTSMAYYCTQHPINETSRSLCRTYCKKTTQPESDKKDEKKSEPDKKEEKYEDDDDSKLTLWGRFKKMYKEYWYVLVPVHLITSIGWFGSFYYIAASGVDIAHYLQMLGLGEYWAKKLTESGAGYIAVAYGLYKIATPARYTVTLAGTTFSINYLKRFGWIKPVPTRKELTQMMKRQNK